MPIHRRDFLRLSGITALGLGLASGIRWSGARAVQASSDGALANSAELHVLNRLTWGPRSVDVERIHAMGIDAYIDWQLAPEAIEDPRVDALLAEYPVLTAPYAEVQAAADEDYGIPYQAALWGRIFRAAYSERQLYELMVEFWTDHFNIPISDYLADKVVDDHEVIRRHAMGKFRDLLFASAKSPAMLYYLDQAYSDREHPNENYAREVMELHTLGVDGGYTEQDVRELARILTGWTVRDSWAGRFIFDPNRHDDGEKVFLGRTFPAGRGIEEGLEALDMLAAHPATARYIAFKLVRRFVADQPPQSLVDSTAQVFIETDGDIRAVLRHLLRSPEFMASAGQKFKRPVHLLVSILRSFDTAFTPHNVDWIIWASEGAGQIPFHWHPPNGYPDVAPAWISTGMLLERWNMGFGLSFAAEDWYEGGDLDLNALLPPATSAADLVDLASKRIINGTLPAEDRAQLISFVTGGSGDRALEDWERGDKLPTLLGLLYASPYFQWY